MDKMIKVKHNANQQYDSGLKFIVKSVKTVVTDKDDDFLLMIVGTTGTGKSNLMLHFMDEFMGDKININCISMDKEGFSKSLKFAKSAPQPRFVCNDEANVSKREALTKYNKDLIDLYFSIRGLSIFHIWCTPSADMIDKPFIEERMKGLILITTKDVKRPRVYYYFRKQDLLKIWLKYKNLKLDTIKRVRGKYAYYRGWFKPYTGPILKEYKELKSSRMSDKVDIFFEKYGLAETMVNKTYICKKLNINRKTLTKLVEKAIDDKKYIEGEDYVIKPNGRMIMNKDTIHKLNKI